MEKAIASTRHEYRIIAEVRWSAATEVTTHKKPSSSCMKSDRRTTAKLLCNVRTTKQSNPHRNTAACSNSLLNGGPELEDFKQSA